MLKEAPPDQLRISLYYLNPLCTTTKNKKTLLNSLRYENYQALYIDCRECKSEGSWSLVARLAPTHAAETRAPAAGTPGPSSCPLSPPAWDGAPGPRADTAPWQGSAVAATRAEGGTGSGAGLSRGEVAPVARAAEAELRSVPSGPAPGALQGDT